MTPSSSQSDQVGVGHCLLAEGTLNISEFEQSPLGSDPSAQGQGGHFPSAQVMLEQSMCTKQTVRYLPPTPDLLGFL